MNEKKEALRIEILKYIEKHSRVELGELAVLLGVEETDVANEMAEMEKEKVICGYHTLIDWDKTGMETDRGARDAAERPRVRQDRRAAVQLSGGLCGLSDLRQL